jgi:hypothetical protein
MKRPLALRIAVILNAVLLVGAFVGCPARRNDPFIPTISPVLPQVLIPTISPVPPPNWMPTISNGPVPNNSIPKIADPNGGQTQISRTPDQNAPVSAENAKGK